MHKLNLPTTREEITVWVLTQSHEKLFLVTYMMHLFYVETTPRILIARLHKWTRLIHNKFPDIYSEQVFQGTELLVIYIAGIPVIEYRNQEQA